MRTLVAAALGLAGALTVAPITAAQDSASKPQWRVGLPEPTTQTQTGAATSDSAFAREAMVGNLVAVRLGKLAQDKASDSRVKQFAQQMVTDHGAMVKEWGRVAPKVTSFESVYGGAQQQEWSQLEKLSGAQFDQAYMTAMIQDHQRDEQTYQSRGLSAQSAEVRQLAASGLATIRQHLSMAREVGRAVGVSAAVATAPQTGLPPTTAGRDTTFAERFPNRKGEVNRRRVADKDFIQNTVAASMMEVRLAELTKQRASDKDVKRFARLVGDQFSDWERRWTALAASTDKSWKPSMGHLHQDKVDQVERGKGKNFDRKYVATVIDHFEALLPYFENEGKGSQSSQVRNLVESELPTLRQNLAIAKRLGDQIGADADDAARNKSVSERR